MVKFEYIGLNAKDEDGERTKPVGSYEGQKCKNGESVELKTDLFIDKARSNPDYREIKPRATKAKKKEAAKAESEE